MQRGVTVRHDFRPRPEPYILKPEDLVPLRITDLAQVDEIMRQYVSLNVPKQHPQIFFANLTQRRDAWFVKAGPVGLIYLTDLVPRVSAQLNVVFWDRHLSKDRREALRSVLATAFDTFALARIGTMIPTTNLPMRRTLQKIGFVYEGTLRKALLPDFTDAVLFGLLREEFTWPAVRMTSSV